jgi:hypothetical protein
MSVERSVTTNTVPTGKFLLSTFKLRNFALPVLASEQTAHDE